MFSSSQLSNDVVITLANKNGSYPEVIVDLSGYAALHRKIIIDLCNYFQIIKAENTTVFKERLQNFQQIRNVIGELNQAKLISLIDEAIAKFGQGHATTRYANLLLLIKQGAERIGIVFFAKYCESLSRSIDEAPSILTVPPVAYVMQNASLQMVQKQHGLFRDQMTLAFFSKIDLYIEKTNKKINTYTDAVKVLEPQAADSVLSYGIDVVSAKLKALIIALKQNIELSKQKIMLITTLKCNILELVTDAKDQKEPDIEALEDINGFIRAMYFYLLIAREDNNQLVANETFSGKGDVEKLLVDTKRWIETYYPNDVLLAIDMYNKNKFTLKM